MKGMRKLAALRSKNTKPKVMVSTQISLVSYFIRGTVLDQGMRWDAGQQVLVLYG